MCEKQFTGGVLKKLKQLQENVCAGVCFLWKFWLINFMKTEWFEGFTCNLYTYRNQSFDLQCKSNDWFLYKMQVTRESRKPFRLRKVCWPKISGNFSNLHQKTFFDTREIFSGFCLEGNVQVYISLYAMVP